jgi:CRP/FNR family transcriptional regulator, cyclic AMP receptor protein
MNNQRKELSFDPKAVLSNSNEERTVLNYAIDQVFYRQGDHADAVFYIQKGKAKLTLTSEEGKEAIVAILGAEDFFGTGCLKGMVLRLSTAVALEECRITRITKSEIGRLIHNEPIFAEFFISRLLDRNSQIEADLIDQLFNSSEKRLARTLLLLANVGKEGESERTITNVNQDTLAAIIGTTRSRVNVFMNKFRRLGLIDYNGKIEVHRSLLNMVLHERPENKKVERSSSNTA